MYDVRGNHITDNLSTVNRKLYSLFFGSVAQAVRLYSVCEAAKASFTWIR